MQRITLEDERDFLDWRDGSGNTVEIFDIQVMSERRTGKGRALVNKLIESMPTRKRTIYAITRASNLIAIAFYQELRFRPILLPDFYKDERLQNGKDYVDAIMFVRDLWAKT